MNAKTTAAHEKAYASHRAGDLAAAEQGYIDLGAGSGDDELDHHYAVLLLQTDRNDLALSLLQQIVQRAPARTDTALVLALACRRLGRVDEGLRAASSAVENGASDAAALAIHGSLQVLSGEFVSGEATLRKALALEPELGEAMHYLGVALHRQQRWAAAAGWYQKAALQSPGDASLQYNFALCAEATGDLDVARQGYLAALALAPRRLDSLSRLANVQALLCDFDGEAASVARMEALLAPSNTLPPDDQAEPFVLTFLPLSNQARDKILRRYVRKVLREAAGLVAPVQQPRETGQPLRIGYLSPDFGEHAVGHLVRDLFAAHDRRRVHVSAYSLRAHDGPVAEAIRAGCDVFREAHTLSTQAIAETIAADRIDILVDLGGFTLGARPAALALRPAPIQMSYLGFIHSSGAPWIDYIVLDGQLAKPGTERLLFSESVIRLPGTMLPAPANAETGAPDRRRFGLPEGVPLFACFNNSYKWDAEFMAACVEIARQVPDGRFVIYLPLPAHSRFLAHWRRMGGNAESVLMVPKLAPALHAVRSASCDVFLDCFRYHAGATGIAAAAAGLPVLCREGKQPLARMGVSLNHFLGMDQLTCRDSAGFIAKAVELAQSGTKTLRQSLLNAVQTHGLLKPRRTAAALEDAFQQAWDRFDSPDSEPA